jgi:hypothetical protein
MESLSWKSHPARERPVTTILVVIFIFLVLIVVSAIMKNGFMIFLAAGIFIISLSSFFFPTTFTVDEKKVMIKYIFSAKERNLSAFRKCYPERNGILLSPYLSPTRLENFRGFYLRYGKNNKAEVDKFVETLLEKQREQMEARAGKSERLDSNEEASDAI